MTSPKDPPSANYVVAIGDLVRSRELEDRASAQERLRDAVQGFNSRAGEALAAPLELTGGDEMKTVVEDPAVVVDVLTRVSEALHPLALVWGVGRGPIETSWVPSAGDLDGPCFHRARRAVEEASEEGSWGKLYGFSPLDDQVGTALLRLMGAVRATWTEQQVRSVRAVRGQTQKEAARELGLTESGVSKSLRRAQFRDVEDGEAALRRLLASYRATEDRPDRPAPDRLAERT